MTPSANLPPPFLDNARRFIEQFRILPLPPLNLRIQPSNAHRILCASQLLELLGYTSLSSTNIDGVRENPLLLVEPVTGTDAVADFLSAALMHSTDRRIHMFKTNNTSLEEGAKELVDWASRNEPCWSDNTFQAFFIELVQSPIKWNISLREPVVADGVPPVTRYIARPLLGLLDWELGLLCERDPMQRDESTTAQDSFPRTMLGRQIKTKIVKVLESNAMGRAKVRTYLKILQSRFLDKNDFHLA